MTLSQVNYRLLIKGDLPALEWGGEYRHFKRLYADIYESMKLGRALMWVAELREVGIIGQLFVQLSSGRTELADGSIRAYIYGFRIKPEYRRQGFGRQMMLQIETDLFKRRFQYATLNVAQDNPQALALYERLGYQVIASDPGRWSYLDHLGNRQEVSEPAWRMQKNLQYEQMIVNS